MTLKLALFKPCYSMQYLDHVKLDSGLAMYNIWTSRFPMFLPLTGVLDWINNLNGNLTPPNPNTLEPGQSIISGVSVPVQVAIFSICWLLSGRLSPSNRVFLPLIGVLVWRGFLSSCWFNVEVQKTASAFIIHDLTWLFAQLLLDRYAKSLMGGDSTEGRYFMYRSRNIK